VKVGVWCALRARIVGPVFLMRELQKLCTGHSQTIISRVNRRRKTLLISERLRYCPRCIYVISMHALSMSSGTELSAVVFGQYVHLILILITFNSGMV
jgi:hypothetical protein